MPGRSADDQSGQQETEQWIPAQQMQTQFHNALLLENLQTTAIPVPISKLFLRTTKYRNHTLELL